jgi:hypothetical protein
MSRSIVALFAGLVTLFPGVALADHWLSWHTWSAHTHANIRWPEQFLDHDRSAARAPFAVMIANGWRAQCTISTYHFNEETGALNDTGRLKVRSVMLETPAEWRTLYVLRADRNALTEARVHSVQEYARELAQGDSTPPVLLTTIEPRGTRGDVSNRVNQQFMESAPAPVLPTISREESGN